MKFSALLLTAYCLLLSPACSPHELETPEHHPPIGGKTDSPKPDFKKEVKDAISASPSYAFGYGNIPLEWIWANINYNSFDYKKFFATKCPDNWENGASWLECKYEDANSKIFFSVSVSGNCIIVNIKNISLTNYFLSRRLQAIWEITGEDTDFTVVKYEKITDSGHLSDYSIITARYIKRENRIIASGSSSSYLSGSFTFETDGIHFTTCPEKPDGYIYIHGNNTVGVNFFQAKNCDSCAPVAFDNQYGKYAYCGPWPLRDLFDYLAPFIQ